MQSLKFVLLNQYIFVKEKCFQNVDTIYVTSEFLHFNKYQDFFYTCKNHSTQWKTMIHFHYPNSATSSPAVFHILKEPFIVQKETLHQQKALGLSYLDLEGQGRGIVRRSPHPHFVKSKFRFFR